MLRSDFRIFKGCLSTGKQDSRSILVQDIDMDYGVSFLSNSIAEDSNGSSGK